MSQFQVQWAESKCPKLSYTASQSQRHFFWLNTAPRRVQKSDPYTHSSHSLSKRSNNHRNTVYIGLLTILTFKMYTD